jgi:hypothetical protein
MSGQNKVLKTFRRDLNEIKKHKFCTGNNTMAIY